MRYPAESRRQDDDDRFARWVRSSQTLHLSKPRWEGRRLSVMMKHRDFTGLARDYAMFRPGYAPQVATAVLSYVGRDAVRVDAADIGAGTGIWIRTPPVCIPSSPRNPITTCAGKESRRTRSSSKSRRRSRGSSPTSGACRPGALASLTETKYNTKLLHYWIGGTRCSYFRS